MDVELFECVVYIIKEIVQPKMYVKSSFAHLDVISYPLDVLYTVEHKSRILFSIVTIGPQALETTS